MNRLKQGLFRAFVAASSSVKTLSTRNISNCLLRSQSPLLLPNVTAEKTRSSLLVLSNRSFISAPTATYAASLSSRNTPTLLTASVPFLHSIRTIAEHTKLWKMHVKGPRIKNRKKRQPLDGKPQAKGVVLKTLVKKPKKPNSANRKCVLVRLSTGKEMVAYVPKEGHNLTEHNIVLVRCGRLQDVPGVKIKCIRGKYDLPHVQKRSAT